jgi:hypothetical protein
MERKAESLAPHARDLCSVAGTEGPRFIEMKMVTSGGERSQCGLGRPSRLPPSRLG